MARRDADDSLRVRPAAAFSAQLAARLRLSLAVLELSFQHVGVGAAAPQERVVVADFEDSAMTEHHDDVRAANRTQTMSDDEGGAVGHQPLHRALDQLLTLRVEITGRFVQNQDLRRGQHGACDRQPLPLASGKLDAPLTDQGVVTLGQTADEIVRVRGAGGLFDLRLGRFGAAVGDVVLDGAIEQKRLLLYDAEQLPIAP